MTKEEQYSFIKKRTIYERGEFMSLRGLSCIFPVPDILKTKDFYVSKLGFRAVDYLECSEPHVCLYKDNAEIILTIGKCEVIPNHTLYGYGFDCYLYTDKQVELESEFNDAGVKFIKHLEVTDYQNKQFVIEDVDGRWLAFGLKVLE